MRWTRLPLVLIGLLAACGGSDDVTDTQADDEFDPAGESPDAGSEQDEAGTNEGSSSNDGSSSDDGSSSNDGSSSDDATGETVDGTADTVEGSTDAESSSDGMDGPMDGPDTHPMDDDFTDDVVETDDGDVVCLTACDCMQGLACIDNQQCAPVPDNAYCCENPGCPAGEDCQFSDGTFGTCD